MRILITWLIPEPLPVHDCINMSRAASLVYGHRKLWIQGYCLGPGVIHMRLNYRGKLIFMLSGQVNKVEVFFVKYTHSPGMKIPDDFSYFKETKHQDLDR